MSCLILDRNAIHLVFSLLYIKSWEGSNNDLRANDFQRWISLFLMTLHSEINVLICNVFFIQQDLYLHKKNVHWSNKKEDPLFPLTLNIMFTCVTHSWFADYQMWYLASRSQLDRVQTQACADQDLTVFTWTLHISHCFTWAVLISHVFTWTAHTSHKILVSFCAVWNLIHMAWYVSEKCISQTELTEWAACPEACVWHWRKDVAWLMPLSTQRLGAQFISRPPTQQ